VKCLSEFSVRHRYDLTTDILLTGRRWTVSETRGRLAKKVHEESIKSYHLSSDGLIIRSKSVYALVIMERDKQSCGTDSA